MPLLVFSDDWGRHPSSCQHLVSRLLPGRQVWWCNTVGTRPPRFDLYTVRRGAGKIREWLRPRAPEVADDGPRPTVLRPAMWPSFRRRWERNLNGRLLAKALAKAIPAGTRPVAIATVPIAACLIGRIPVRQWLYYCVDDLAAWPGLDRQPLDEMERELVAKADRIVAASENLRQRIAGMGRESTLLTHGVDQAWWSAGGPAPAWEWPRPWIVFWGLIDRRLDLETVRALAALPGTVVLAGPENNPDPALSSLPNVRRPGALPFADLPGVATAADVLVMPYGDLEATRAMQPLKFKEYLASGKPVVARRLPATAEWADAADLCATPAEFAAAVRRRLAEGVPAGQQAARRRLAAESWEAKAKQFAAAWGEALV